MAADECCSDITHDENFLSQGWTMSLCTRCGAIFGCAMADGSDGPCWCTALPPMVPVPLPGAPAVDAGCWCPACLRAHIAEAASSQHNQGGLGKP
jgi:hypothetical protein